MKHIVLENTDLANCIAQAKEERVVVTRGGSPAAIIINIEGLDAEDLDTASSVEFWRMINECRQQPTIDRAVLERKLLQPKV